jgi:vacuolar protein sorting-associated protein 72
MSADPADPADPGVMDSAPPSETDHGASASESDSEPEVPELMVVSRQRRSNAGNRMSTLLAKAAEEEQWGEEWEEAPNEEEFVGDDANDQDDFNMDSSSSEEGDDEARDDDAGEKELRKAERQERNKRRKTATNPFTARLAAAASRKKVRLDVPPTESTAPAPRPKKKSERASWIPTEEDGPIRTSGRKQTVANKESTLARLKEKDKRRDDTLAMMKAAEARKAKHAIKPMTQAERLTEAARVERKNSKSLHRWEEAEEQRAADRQAKLDALKNRQIDGPFIRYYSGPAIWVDDKLKYTGKDAPKIEDLEKTINKDGPSQPTQSQSETVEQTSTPQDDTAMQDPSSVNQTQISQVSSQMLPPYQAQDSQPPQAESTHTPQAFGQPDQGGSFTTQYPNSPMLPPPQNDSFLYGIEQYSPSQLPPNPFVEYPQFPTQSPFSPHPPSPFTQQSPFSQPHPLNSDSVASYHLHNPPNVHSLPPAFQRPPPPAMPPAPPRKKQIRRALRNLLILSSFSNLDDHVPSKSRSSSSAMKDRDRASLINISSALFNWSTSDATAFINAMMNAPKESTRSRKDKEALSGLKVKKEVCAVTNLVARYRDPGTGIAYRDARAYGVLRGIVGGGFVWSGSLGCYVGARPSGINGKGLGSMQPVVGVPKRFLEMGKPTTPTPVPAPASVSVPAESGIGENVGETSVVGTGDVKMEDVSIA